MEVALLATNIISVLRRANAPISEPDAWIAATAIRYQLPLITRNHLDFNFIDDLELIPVRAPSPNP